MAASGDPMLATIAEAPTDIHDADARTVTMITDIDMYVRTAAILQRAMNTAMNDLARVRYAQGADSAAVALLHTATRARQPLTLDVDSNGRLCVAHTSTITAVTGTPVNVAMRSFERVIEVALDWANTYSTLTQHTQHLQL